MPIFFANYAYAAQASERKFADALLARAYKAKKQGHGMPNGRC